MPVSCLPFIPLKLAHNLYNQHLEPEAFHESAELEEKNLFSINYINMSSANTSAICV
jgi:hypothetical protein